MQEFINQFFDVGFMVDHFDEVLEGFWVTIQLSVLSGILALIWGLILATLRQLPGKGFMPVRAVTIAYIDVFRGIPLLILILIIAGGVPALEFLPESLRLPQWFGKPDNFWFGVLAITITYGAYMAEVYRSGIESVPGGQMEAARSLGMSHGQAMRNVILPQAVRKVIAPLLNDFVALTKDTTLVSVIALSEVTQVANDIQSETFNSSALVLGALLFLAVTLPLARLIDKLIAREQGRFTRGAPRVEAL
ncbi:MAG TPA: amino acid ABC transporter permease [Solirubrobacterales bacterium]|jgi:polar amino acid transport system permease protein|nr:amino acid ABC transporter permease [Solirubrobacterales bacterium]